MLELDEYFLFVQHKMKPKINTFKVDVEKYTTFKTITNFLKSNLKIMVFLNFNQTKEKL